MIDNYLNKPTPEMLGDLTAQATEQQDRQARAMGYPSHEAMMLYLRRRSEPNQHPSVSGGSGAADHPAGGDAMSWHPANVFRFIAEKLKQATSGE